MLQIVDSARRHGIADEDIRHAVQTPMVIRQQDEGRVLFIGGDRTGRPLEVVVIDVETDDPVAIHAMEARPRFAAYLGTRQRE